jgi:hypothetical protein
MIETKDRLFIIIRIRHFCQVSPVLEKDFLSLKAMVSRKYLLFIGTLYYIRSLLLAEKYNYVYKEAKSICFPKSIFLIFQNQKQYPSKSQNRCQNHYQNQDFNTKTIVKKNTAKPRVLDLVYAYAHHRIVETEVTR